MMVTVRLAVSTTAVVFVLTLIMFSGAESEVECGGKSASLQSSCCSSSSCALDEVASIIREGFRDLKNLVSTSQLGSKVESSKQALVSALVRK